LSDLGMQDSLAPWICKGGPRRLCAVTQQMADVRVSLA
jgi:hypothetical protein